MCSSMLVSIVGITSVLFGVTAAALLLVLATVFANQLHSVNILAFLAASLQFVSQITISHLIWVRSRTIPVFSFRSAEATQRVRDFRNILPSIFFGLLAGGATIATFVWADIRFRSLSTGSLGREPWIVSLCSFIFCLFSILAQAFLYVCILSQGRNRLNEANEISHETVLDFPGSQEMYETSRPGTALTDQSNTNEITQDWSSQPATPRNAETTSSLRSSLTITVHPSASKTKLLAYRKSSTRDVKTPTSASSPSRISQDSGFDNWDTSSVAPQIRETVHQSSPIVRSTTVLTPIPGSRSPSPAKALEGPFLLPAPTTSSSSIPPTSPLPNYSRLTTRQRSASNDSYSFPHRSFSLSEEHIHPLFRTNSPTPPPSATPGTMVTAAPGSFSGLVMNERELLLHRMRSGSLPSSPSPLGLATPFFDTVETMNTEGDVGTEEK